jgi:hypothetical protein
MWTGSGIHCSGGGVEMGAGVSRELRYWYGVCVPWGATGDEKVCAGIMMSGKG